METDTLASLISLWCSGALAHFIALLHFHLSFLLLFMLYVKFDKDNNVQNIYYKIAFY